MRAEGSAVGGRVVQRARAKAARCVPRCTECAHAHIYGPGASAFCVDSTGLRSGQELTRDQAACTQFAPRM
jgi:hypothetical protein